MFLAIAVVTCQGLLYWLHRPSKATPREKKNASVTPKPVVNELDPAPDITPSVILRETGLATVVPISDVTVSDVAAAALASVVQINCKVTRTDSWGRLSQGNAQGSGIILSLDDDTLYVATNNHVVENASEITVTFPDGTDVPFTLRGVDNAGDLAILSVKVFNLPETVRNSYQVAKLALTEPVKVGDMVIALGNALGYGTSLTVGYVSATEREVSTESGSLLLIQTDAAINPGNSGGALINMKGEVIGINSAKYTSEDVEGMGFAIPITQALPILNELKTLEDFPEEEAGYLGVYITNVTSKMNADFDWPSGVYVKSVMEGSAAQAAGLLPGDIITAVNGIRVLDTEQLSARVTAYRAGTRIKLSVSRDNGISRENIVVTVTLMERAKMPDDE